jgi:hypothetical protein
MIGRHILTVVDINRYPEVNNLLSFPAKIFSPDIIQKIAKLLALSKCSLQV